MPGGYWDNSNAQFAILGLHSAASAGIKIPRESWERVEKHFLETQNPDGGWGYQRGGSGGSMSCAGLFRGGEGLEWLAGQFTVEENPNESGNQFYYLYGLERVGVLAGTEFLGDHEWYPEGAQYLLAQQSGDGSWTSKKSPPSSRMPKWKNYWRSLILPRRAKDEARSRLYVAELSDRPSL